MTTFDPRTEKQCPKCWNIEEDFDGVGMQHCYKCGYCQHSVMNGSVCELCGKEVGQAK